MTPLRFVVSPIGFHDHNSGWLSLQSSTCHCVLVLSVPCYHSSYRLDHSIDFTNVCPLAMMKGWWLLAVEICLQGMTGPLPPWNQSSCEYLLEILTGWSLLIFLVERGSKAAHSGFTGQYTVRNQRAQHCPSQRMYKQLNYYLAI